jgi:protein SCO1
MTRRLLGGIGLGLLFLVTLPLTFSLFFATQSGGKIEIDEPIDAPYLRSVQSDTMLVYFGYVGCAKICTPILDHLAQLNRKLEGSAATEEVGIVFVNLRPEVEPEQADAFARGFDPDFEGIYLTRSQLMNLDRELGVFFSAALGDETEINHSDHLYLIRREGGKTILKAIYPTHPIDQERIRLDLESQERNK